MGPFLQHPPARAADDDEDRPRTIMVIRLDQNHPYYASVEHYGANNEYQSSSGSDDDNDDDDDEYSYDDDDMLPPLANDGGGGGGESLAELDVAIVELGLRDPEQRVAWIAREGVYHHHDELAARRCVIRQLENNIQYNDVPTIHEHVPMLNHRHIVDSLVQHRGDLVTALQDFLGII